MKDENVKKYSSMTFGYAGFLLMGLAVFRSLEVLQDTVMYALTMFGYIFLSIYFQFADTKIGASKKDKFFFRVGFLVILGVIAFYIY